MKTKISKGFTLIELLIVIAIIGILAVALLPNVLNAPKKGRDATRIANVSSIAKAIEAYNVEQGSYPFSALTCLNSATTTAADFMPGKKYINDPSNNASYLAAGAMTGSSACAGVLFCPLTSGYALITKFEADTAKHNATATACDGTAASMAAGTDVYALVN